MTAGLGIFASGWLQVWQIATILTFIPCVAVPAAVQGASSLRAVADHDPLSLGTFSIVTAVALYFALIAMVNGVLIARAMGAHWLVAALVGLAAGCGLCVTTGTLMYEMAGIGGPVWVATAWIGLLALLVLNVGAPRWAGSGEIADAPAGSAEMGL